MSIRLGADLLAGTPDTSDFADTNLSNLTSAGKDVIDGDFVPVDTKFADNVSLSNSSNVTYTLTDLPNDGKNYMVAIMATCGAGTTTGDKVTVALTSYLCTSDLVCCRAQRSTGAGESAGSIWIPVGGDRNVTLLRSTDRVGWCNLYLRGYRRMGTN